MTTISARDLCIKIAGNTILYGLNLTCEPGTMTAITGVSGSGKSTLLNALGLLLPPSQGEVLVDASPTAAWGEKKRLRYWKNHAAFIFQDFGVIEEESLAFNITLSKTLPGRQPRAIADVLGHVGLAGREKVLAAVLSGGEKQRLGIARAIYKHADVLYADEPTASLDAENRKHVLHLLQSRAQAGITVIIATHDERLAERCDQCIEL